MSAPRRLQWWVALPVAVLGGLLLDLATPWVAWWPGAFLGTALVMLALWQQRAWVGLVAGIAAGAAFWGPHISWLTLYLGPVPWLGLCGMMLVWFALYGLLVACATRGLAALRIPAGARIALQVLTAAALWVAREQVQSTWPYGGFAWGRIAHTQAEGPYAALVSWVGFAGLSGVMALGVAALIALAFAVDARRGGRSPVLRSRLSAAAAALVVAAVALAFVPVAGLDEVGTLRVAAVQGNSKSGIFDDRESGDVLRDHLEATEQLLDTLAATGSRVDVIVWPENSAEFDLPGNRYGALAVQRLAARADAPIVIGTILRDADGTYTNSTLVIDADGETGERYDKRRPVPFAEYMPNREFFHALAPDLVDLVQLEYRAGTRSSVLTVDGASGAFEAGIAICFDIIFDDQAEAMVRDGAEVIFAQTNNADFGRTDESAQQLQIARLRAIETGRALVNVSTVGTSAVVLPDGSDADRLPTFTSGAMIAEVPLVAGETPALRFGAAISTTWLLIAAAGTFAGVWGLFASGRHRVDRAGGSTRMS